MIPVEDLWITPGVSTGQDKHRKISMEPKFFPMLIRVFLEQINAQAAEKTAQILVVNVTHFIPK